MQLIAFDELDTKKICTYLEDKIYKEIELCFVNIEKAFSHQSLLDGEHEGLLYSLVSKLKEEVEFIKRKEIIILFPFVNKVVDHQECRSELFKN